MMGHTTQSNYHRHLRSSQRGFTLIEILVAVGIIVLLTALAIPAVLHAKKKAADIRVKSDLALIGSALNAYRDEFDGQYPQFPDATTSVAAKPIAGSGGWLDFQNCRGAVLLCRALLGPGPAGFTGSTSQPRPGDDGADGPGFRVRRSFVGTAYTGKVYGPYIDSSKFKLQYYVPVAPNDTTIVATNPMAYPVLLDINGTPILYYPATVGNTPSTLDYADPATNPVNAVSRFNGFDNQAFLDSTVGGTAFDKSSYFSTQAANCGSPNYLLWSAGADGQFSMVNGKSDDVTSFGP